MKRADTTDQHHYKVDLNPKLTDRYEFDICKGPHLALRKKLSMAIEMLSWIKLPKSYGNTFVWIKDRMAASSARCKEPPGLCFLLQALALPRNSRQAITTI